MKKLTVNLQNCYGIKKLKDFDFEFNDNKTKVFAIYAPNGSMKTSFAKVFQKLQSGTKKDLDDIKDHIFERESIVEIKVDDADIEKEEIYVVKSFKNFYESKNMANLLIDNELKERLKEVLKNRNIFFSILGDLSGFKKKIAEMEDQLLKDFSIDSFLQNLDEFNKGELEYDYSNICYNNIFDDAVKKKIESDEFQNGIEEFLVKSDEVYGQYDFLEKGKLSLAKLKGISKKLKDENFFSKENKIILSGENDPIEDWKELDKKIKDVENILKETDAFKKIEISLSDVKGVVLKDIIENNPEIVKELKKENLDELQRKLWLSYIVKNKESFKKLKDDFQKFSAEKQSRGFDNTPWYKAYEKFDDRFTVPFKMEISNKVSSIIGEKLPKVIFKFYDKEQDRWIPHDREKIEVEILSQGEKRSLYLLNIIFDIEERKERKQKTLFIIDDIADSFDYQNKYAIIEYLKEISEEENFYSIILTHNFDFFRTIHSRLSIHHKNCFSVAKTSVGIELKDIEKQSIINPFKNWKDSIKNNKKCIIVLIPFVRNLINYGIDNKKDYIFLTHLLHKKVEIQYDKNGKYRKTEENNEVSDDFVIKKTEEITFGDIKEIYKQYLRKSDFGDILDTETIYAAIFGDDNSDGIVDSIQNFENTLENKIILAIAIRLKAEEFMIKRIDDCSFVNSIEKDQAITLFKKYKKLFETEEENLEILGRVNIMTPENIHLNSFMYEPILDMDIVELKGLYEEFKTIDEA